MTDTTQEQYEIERLGAENARLRAELAQAKTALAVYAIRDCPDCMLNEEAVGEGTRCARHEIEFLRKQLAQARAVRGKLKEDK